MENRDKVPSRSIGLSQGISDDPFDVLSLSLYKERHGMHGEDQLQPQASVLGDDVFRQLLTRDRTETVPAEEDAPYGIFAGMRLLARTEIDVETRRMYKFPFDLETRNDGSELFRKLYSEYLVAVKSVFKEYRGNRLEFYMKLGDNFLHFGPSLRITAGMKRVLASNDIGFREDGLFLVVEGMEVMLVFDYIVNLPFSSSLVIPFLLSAGQFDNSIAFLVQLERKSAVKRGDEVLYSYELTGPFWADDYRQLAKHDNKLF